MALKSASFFEPLRPLGRFGPAVLAFVLLMIALVAGGGGSPAPMAELIVHIAALVVLALAAFVRRDAMRLGALVRRDWLLFALFAVLALAMLAQLVPLPPEIWTALPGRAMIAENAKAFSPQPSLPFSIVPTMTLAALLALVAPFAAYALAGATRSDERDWLLPALLLFGVATVLFQLVQLGTDFALYTTKVREFVSGFQANRNAQGDILAILLAALATRPYSGTARERAGFTIVQITLAATLVLAAVLTGSRAGIALCLAMSAVALGREAWARRRASSRTLSAIVIGGALFIATSAALLFSNANVARALSRFGDEDNGRLTEVWPDAWYAAQQVMPWGTGFGSFVPTFRIFESQEVLNTTTANRAHNEVLELLIEGGPAALAVALLALLVVLFGAFVVFRRGLTPAARSRGALLLLVSLAMTAHSLIDYPIRSLSIAVLWALLVGLVAADRADLRSGQSNLAPRDGRARRTVGDKARIAASLALIGLVLAPVMVANALDRARRPQPFGLSCALPTPNSCASEVVAILAKNPKATVTPLTFMLARNYPANAALQALHGSRLVAAGSSAGTIFLHNSARLGWREPLGQINAFEAALAAGDVSTAVLHLDALARAHPDVLVGPNVLDSMLAREDVRGEWAARMAGEPPFIADLLRDTAARAEGEARLDDAAWRNRISLLLTAQAAGMRVDDGLALGTTQTVFGRNRERAADLWSGMRGQGEWARGGIAWSPSPAAGRLPERTSPFVWAASPGRAGATRVERSKAGEPRIVIKQDATGAASRLASITIFLAPGYHELRWRVFGTEPVLLFPAVACGPQAPVSFDLGDASATDRGLAVIGIPRECDGATITITKARGRVPRGAAIGEIEVDRKRLLL